MSAQCLATDSIGTPAGRSWCDTGEGKWRRWWRKSFPLLFVMTEASVKRGNSPRACRSAKTDFCKRVRGIKSDDSNRSQAVLVQVNKTWY